jgi:hypothetical protein
MFANFFVRPTDNLSLWDQATSASNRKLAAIAGNDAHSNVGLSLNDASGKQWIGVKLDPYERSFRTVRTHVLIPKSQGLGRESLLAALSQGHCYLSFDIFGDPKGFSFEVENSDKIMGDDTASTSQMGLIAKSPLASRFVLLKNGVPVDHASGAAARFALNGGGSYRVEVYLDSLPAPAKGQPWILSNPIYVR